MNLRRMLATAIVVTAISMPAHAQNWTQAANTQRAKIEAKLRDALNDPDSLKIDHMTIYKVGLNRFHACGTLRARNAHGGYVRQNFVVTEDVVMPVYIGPVPFTAFAKDCAGEVIYSK